MTFPDAAARIGYTRSNEVKVGLDVGIGDGIGLRWIGWAVLTPQGVVPRINADQAAAHRPGHGAGHPLLASCIAGFARRRARGGFAALVGAAGARAGGTWLGRAGSSTWGIGRSLPTSPGFATALQR